MVFDLEFLAGLVRQKIRFLRAELSSVRDGRGDSLRELISLSCDSVEQRLDEVLAESRQLGDDVDAASIANHSREVGRLLDHLAGSYGVLSTYRGDAGRQDLPVGLLNLVDQIISELLPDGADPIIRSDHEENYSTAGLALAFPGVEMSGANPIAIHVPALNPSNALLAPLLAHELAHGADIQGVMERLEAVWEADGKLARILKDGELLTGPIRRGGADDLTQNLFNWIEELFCDAVAVALTGPSYLYAIAHFLAVPNVRPGGTHPPDRLRLSFVLGVLDRCGWEPLLSERQPELFTWATALAKDVREARNPRERFLRQSVLELLADIESEAIARVKHPLDPANFVLRSDEAIEMIVLGIPPVDLESGRLGLWEIILAGWVSKLSGAAAVPGNISSTATDQALSALLIKTIELVKTVELWERS